MRQNSSQKTRSKRGRQGQTGRSRNTDRTTGKEHGTIDHNPTADKGKTDTIYKGGNRCTTSDSNETRVAEGRCRELNN